MSISLFNLTKAFGAAAIVEDLSLEIAVGEIVILQGSSGIFGGLASSAKVGREKEKRAVRRKV